MSPRTASVLRWSLLALLGLVVAVAVGVAAAALTSNQIGLSEEPIRAGEALAPESDGGHGRDRHGDDREDGGHGDGDSTSTTTTTSMPEPTSTSDDSEDDEDEDD
jgi:hypothetical protein